jgi:tetratricopeptide (TPR) repeat protein
MKVHRSSLILLAVCSLLIAAPEAWAQGGKGKGRLQGVVLDEAGAPVESAKVVLDLHGRETAQRTDTTNKKGEWAVLGLGSGNWQVTVTAEGYIPDSQMVNVSQIERNPKVVTKLKKPEASQDAVIKDEASLAYIEQATKHFNDKEYDQALAILEQFLEQNPEAYQVQMLIGDCHREKGDLDRAVEIYGQAVEDARADEKQGIEVMAKGLAALGDVFLRKGDLDKAQDYFKRSVDSNPENEVLAYNVGEIFFSNHKLDEAITYYLKATEIKPSWATPFYKLGLTSLNKADYDKAKEYFQKYLGLEPEGELAAQARNILDYLGTIKK